MRHTFLIFLDASVILAGLHSPTGASAKILTLCRTNVLSCVISEIVLSEVLRHADKVRQTPQQLLPKIQKIATIVPAPKKLSKRYLSIVTDKNDVHLFTSCEQLKTTHLVSLDKKHVLSMKGKTQGFQIVSPAELIEFLSTLAQ